MDCFPPISGRRRCGQMLLALAGLCCLSLPTQAEENIACVRCAGPDRTYRCHAMSDEPVPAEAIRFFCMSQIAHDNVHESCAVVRGTGPCEGREVSYVYQADAADPIRAGNEAQPAKTEPTLADITRDTVEASKKAGKAVSDATKRTLKCLGSALMGC